MAQRQPKRRNATKMLSSVRVVRNFFRFKLLQMRPKNFMGGAGNLKIGGALARRRLLIVTG